MLELNQNENKQLQKNKESNRIYIVDEDKNEQSADKERKMGRERNV